MPDRPFYERLQIIYTLMDILLTNMFYLFLRGNQKLIPTAWPASLASIVLDKWKLDT